MGQKYLLAIDSGTQSTRVSIFNEKGDRLVTGSAQHPLTTSPVQGWHEHGTKDFWDALCIASKEAFAQFDGNKEDIVGASVSSQRICVCIVDEKVEFIHNPVSWMDGRWRMNYASMGAMPEDIEDLSYQFFMPYFSQANWMKYNKPEIYEKAYKYLNVSGFLGAKLTGEYRDSIANNVGWPYNYEKWEGLAQDRYVELMGYRKDQLAEPVAPGTLIGRITAEAAAQTGMPEGCPLYTSAGDKQCELLGAGIVKHGQAYITLGTLSGVDVVSKDYTPSPTFAYSTYLACYPGMYNYEAPLGKGFWLVSWFRENFGLDLKAEADSKGTSIEDLLNKEADAIPAGAQGLVLLPDWSPGGDRPYSKGIFLGFDDRHGRGHMYRALIEGIVMEIKAKSDMMEASLGLPVTELYIGGGGSKSDFCSQTIADVFNVPVYRSHDAENSSLGVAMCAAVGSGVYASFDDSIKGMVSKFDAFKPNAENHELYTKLRKDIIEQLYPRLEDVLKELGELTGEKQ